MKIELKLLLALFLLCRDGHAQGFINLKFETTTISEGTATIPGWSVNTDNYVNGDTNSIPYNNIALDSPSVNLEGTNCPFPSVQAIQGNYSIFIQGGTRFAQDTNGGSIWQTGQIPLTAQTIIYWGNLLQVLFNGQMLVFSAINTTANYTVWGADISSYAGQTGQLLFTAPWKSSGMLDNIQFSPSPVPEPSVLSLSALGGLLLTWRRWKKP